MAEFVMKKLVKEEGLQDYFYIESAATSSEEIWNGKGNPVYPPARRKLSEHGISCAGKEARQTSRADYKRFDYLIGMDAANIRNMARIYGGDPEGKISMLLSHAGISRDVADPWYTGDFESTWQDVMTGCTALLEELKEKCYD